METIVQQRCSSSLHTHPPPHPVQPQYCKRLKLTPPPPPTYNNYQTTNPNTIIDHHHIINKATFENLLQQKKLSLVLDLDQTLLHTVRVAHLTPQDRHLILKETYDPGLSTFFRLKLTDDADFLTKLRPGLQRFLDESSKLFQLHLFTKGSREYVMEVLKLIDPGNEYFGCSSKSKSSPPRVLTRESCLGKKNLDLVMGKESGILIIDDNESAWRDVDKKNVIEIPKYDFFELGGGRNRLSGLVEGGTGERELEDGLDRYLGLLKVIHAMFFDPRGEGDIQNRDVRVLKDKLFNYFKSVIEHTKIAGN